MSLPYIFAATFDTGDASEWDSETDVSGALDFPHYTTMAAIPNYPAPYRGAYCMRIVAPANTADHIVTEGDLNIAAGATAWARFFLYISKDFAATANDIFNILELLATATIETAISLQITAATDLVEIGIGETAASSFPSTLSKGQWHMIELSATVDSGGGNDGTSTLYVDGKSIQTISTLDQGAVTSGTLGTTNTLATTDAGFLLFDDFAFDDTRTVVTHRFALQRVLSASGFAFVGPGKIGNVKLIDTGGGDVVCELYDVDEYTASMEPRWYGQTSTANVDVDAADVPIDFARGCLVVMSGTTPAVQINVMRASAWGGDGAVRNYAARRGTARLGV